MEQRLIQMMRERILLIDGAMGTMVQTYGLDESDFRGERFSNHEVDLKGNNEALLLTKPEVISEIHEKYLAAGSDIIETNTFSSTSISMADYKMENLVYELSETKAKPSLFLLSSYSYPVAFVIAK